MDSKQLAGKVLAETGIKIDADDPAFVLVVLNRLVLEEAGGQVEKKLTEAGDRLSKTVTANVDQFVTVANEAIAKFADKTRELAASVDRLSTAPTGRVAAATSTAPPATAPGAHSAHPQWLWWFIPISFVLGVVVGVLGAVVLRQ